MMARQQVVQVGLEFSIEQKSTVGPVLTDPGSNALGSTEDAADDGNLLGFFFEIGLGNAGPVDRVRQGSAGLCQYEV
jgi:hypothetical protein